MDALPLEYGPADVSKLNKSLECISVHLLMNGLEMLFL